MNNDRSNHDSDDTLSRDELTDMNRRLDRYARLLDSSIPLPGGYRIGLDGLIGLIPGFGDAAGAALSSYILMEAMRAGAPASIIARMVLNVLAETVVGAIPIAGDLFDFVFKANLRNVRLLQNYQGNPRAARRASRLKVGLWVTGIIVGVVLVLWLVIELLSWLIGLF